MGEKRFTHIICIHSVSNQLSSSCICILFCIFVFVCIYICVCICMCIYFCICIFSISICTCICIFSVFVCVFVFVLQCVWGAHPHLYIRRIHSVRNQVSSSSRAEMLKDIFAKCTTWVKKKKLHRR